MDNLFKTMFIVLTVAGCGELPIIDNGRITVECEDLLCEIHAATALTVSSSPDLTETLDEAMSYWNEGFNRELFIPVEEDANIVVTVVPLSTWGLTHWHANRAYVMSRGRIEISSALPMGGQCSKTVLIHELGHMLGLADDVSTGGIMDTDGDCDSTDLLGSDRDLVIQDLE